MLFLKCNFFHHLMYICHANFSDFYKLKSILLFEKANMSEYEKFKVIQDKDFQSDFDKLIIDIKRIECFDA